MLSYDILLMDADETLLDFCRSERYALQTTLAAHGVDMTDAMQEAYHDINRLLWEQLERGEITRDRLKVERFERFLATIDLKMDAAAFNTAYMQAIGTKGFVFDGAVELLQILSKHYRISIITNGTASVQHTRFADSGLLDYIDDLFISEEIGADKPSTVFFDRVCESLGNPDRSRLLVIGDSLTSDIRGGIQSGIDTCWYNPSQKDCPAALTPAVQVASYAQLLAFLGVA